MSQIRADNLNRVLTDPAWRASIPAWNSADLRASPNRLGTRNVSVDHVLDQERADRGHDHEDDFDQKLRFKGIEAERELWLTILPKIESNRRVVGRFNDCGSGCSVFIDPDTQRYVLRSHTCHLRFCPVCRRRIQKATIERLTASLGTIKRHTWQFITLTLRHTDRPLPEQLATLRKAFRNLRQQELWRTSVDRGFAILEVAYNSKKDEWHPHIHVLAHTEYIDWGLLRKAWKHVTAGSDNIDAAFINTAKSAATYVAKYLGKPPPTIFLERLGRATEYYQATRRSKFLITFGRHPERPQQLPLPISSTLEALGTLMNLWIASRSGDPTASKHLDRLKLQLAAETSYYARTLPGPPDPEHRPRPPPDAYRTVTSTEESPPF